MTASPTPRPNASTILVIQTAFPGDIVLTSSFLAGLRTLAPTAEIYFLTTVAGAQLLTPNPWNVRLITYDKRGREKGLGGFLRKSRELRALAPDITFCLHRSLRSTLLAKLSGGKIYGFREGVGSVLFSERVSRRGMNFEAEKNLAVLEAWAGERARKLSLLPTLATSPADEASADSLLAGLNGQKFVALAPSSVWATKRWPVEKFAEVALHLWQKYQLRTAIVGGKDSHDIRLGQELKALIERAGATALDLSGQTSLGVLKAVLGRPEMLVANDSAPLHIAIARGTKVVGVFGPTTKELGFFPLGKPGSTAVAEVVGLSCRPCGLHGHHACPQGHFRCMLELNPAKVIGAVDKLLCP